MKFCVRLKDWRDAVEEDKKDYTLAQCTRCPLYCKITKPREKELCYTCGSWDKQVIRVFERDSNTVQSVCLECIKRIEAQND